MQHMSAGDVTQSSGRINGTARNVEGKNMEYEVYETPEGYKACNGRIISPGKFEGEPDFAPSFWFAGLEGLSDSDDGETFTFRITKDDKEKFPNLKSWIGRGRVLKMREDSQGFVHCF